MNRSPHTGHAVQRLHDCRAHQYDPVREMKHNWRGWFASTVFHVSLLLIFMSVTWTIFSEKREYVILNEKTPTHKDLETEPIDELLDRSLFDAPVEGVSSTRALMEKPDVGSWNKDDVEGVPDWIGGPFKGTKLGLGGIGGDDHRGLPPGPFRRHVGGIKQLDIVFVFDSTGSMGGVINEVKTRIRSFMAVITSLVPNTRLGMVTYRDLKKYDVGEWEYTVRYTRLADGSPAGMRKLVRFLRETEAYGGGDIPEAVYNGLATAIAKAGWRQGSKKIIIVFGDAPPRPENNGLAKITDLCRVWHEKTGGIVCCIDTSGGSRILSEFEQMARDGGGRASFLNDERDIIKNLVLHVFPKKYEDELDKWYRRFAEHERTDGIVEE